MPLIGPRLPERAFRNQHIRAAEEACEIFVIGCVPGVTKSAAAILDPRRKAFGGVWCLRDRKTRFGSEFDAITGFHDLNVDWKFRLEDFAPERGLQSVDNVFESRGTQECERFSALAPQSIAKREEQRSQLAGVIDVKMTDEQVSHSLPGQAVSIERMHGPGAAVHHQASVREFDE